MRVPRFSAGVGVALFLAAFVLVQAPFAARALLIVPLLLVPYRLQAQPTAAWLALATGVVLAAAYGLEQGQLAGVLSLPWFATCALLAVPGVLDGLRGLPSIFRPANAARLLNDAARAFLAVGATFALIDRFGVSVLDFDRNIVLVTAVHFHVLGFALISLAAVLATRSRWATLSAFPFLLGIPLTAAGFTFGSTLLQWVGSVFVVAGALLVAAALAEIGVRHSGWRRAAAWLAAAALSIGAPMGLAWATALHFAVPFLDFQTMAVTHGALNTVAVVVATFAVPEPPR
jgi:YndJ-like protein